MTSPIEAGARAVINAWEAEREVPFPLYDREATAIAKACIEAAIASGALVPAAQLAAERERCIQAVRDADGGHFTTKVAVILAIRALEPASGDCVLVPREPTEAMMAAVDCAGEKANWPSGRAWATGYRAMIAAASPNGRAGT